MGIELRGKNGAIDLSLKMIKGDDGGYYIPSLDSEGNLTWAPSEVEMPAVDGANIKGPKGDTGTSGVWVGDTEPTGDYNVWIDPTGSETAGLATKAELANKQDKLTAGDNITIDSNNIISATGLVTKAELASKQDKLTAGDNITIENNVISASGLVTQAELANKQDKLTAGDNITIDSDNVISATQPTKISELTNDSGFITNEYHDATKQDKLVAGDNITIDSNNMISATGLATQAELENKQDKLTAGTNITIDSNNVISASGSGGGGSSYTFTDGLTETDGTVKWDLSDRIKKGKYAYADYGGVIIGWSDNYNNIYANNKGSISCGMAYGGQVSTSGIGSLALGYANNGYIKNSKAGSITCGTVSQGDIINEGEGSFVCGHADYGGKIKTEDNLRGSLLVGVSDRSQYNSNMGSLTTNGQGTLTIGLGVQNKGWGSTVLGMANIVSTTGTYNTRGDYAFIYGNGTSDSARSNAYTLDWQGNGTFAGTVSSSTGADYAEYFEWKDGNPNNEDRVGYIVTLDGDKIVKANTGDDILGICSGTAMVLGDSAEWNWSKRYLTDDFGRIIYEDYDVDYKEDNGEITKRHIHAPKQNPDYDTTKTYTKRADRPEWQIVGMMGKLYVRDDGSCVINGYADVVNGIATKATGKTNMRVMERINDSIVRVLLK